MGLKGANLINEQGLGISMSDYKIGKEMGMMKASVEGLISDIQLLIKRMNIMQAEINKLKPKK